MLCVAMRSVIRLLKVQDSKFLIFCRARKLSVLHLLSNKAVKTNSSIRDEEIATLIEHLKREAEKNGGILEPREHIIRSVMHLFLFDRYDSIRLLCMWFFLSLGPKVLVRVLHSNKRLPLPVGKNATMPSGAPGSFSWSRESKRRRKHRQECGKEDIVGYSSISRKTLSIMQLSVGTCTLLLTGSP